LDAVKPTFMALSGSGLSMLTVGHLARGVVDRAEVVSGGKVRIKAKMITPFALQYVSILAIYPENITRKLAKTAWE
jgi:hypothetical protein